MTWSRFHPVNPHFPEDTGNPPIFSSCIGRFLTPSSSASLPIPVTGNILPAGEDLIASALRLDYNLPLRQFMTPIGEGLTGSFRWSTPLLLRDELAFFRQQRRFSGQPADDDRREAAVEHPRFVLKKPWRQ